ncbi:MAG: leucyl aminopeptidase family protein [Alphaproteobacteria bacterium]|nr:leucyl aminopeptidase family protein [Alphaproteobacteria bacterium]
MAIDGLTARAGKTAVPVLTVAEDDFEAWCARQSARTRNWVRASGFRARPGSISLMAADDGGLERVLLGLPTRKDQSQGAEGGAVWAFAACPAGLPEGRYRLAGRPGAGLSDDAALGWALGSYRFTRYRKSDRAPALLVWPAAADRKRVENAALATFLVRDLVNTPAGDMGPGALAAEARRLGRAFGARVSVITGAKLLERNYPAIHAVGRAAADAPRLIDLTWQPAPRRRLPRVTICGKGVCFDTGGLDLKSTAGIKLMKKDMGGAAQALGLARMIMGARLPVRLRVLIPAVENAVAGNAYHPLDVLPTRKGITVEVGNTDAEGRIVLADALAEACRETPDLLIDMATLTGAARVALGTGLPALFCNDDSLAEKTLAAGRRAGDPLWRLPLWAPYRDSLESQVADINNISSGPYGGAITAALFLKEFVTAETPWIHLDFMAWNPSSRPGRPEGGEAQGMRALFALIEKEFTG